ncbi:MAG TPA: hypothetical protein VGL08_20405 [Paraburkholderia sp.]
MLRTPPRCGARAVFNAAPDRQLFPPIVIHEVALDDDAVRCLHGRGEFIGNALVL